jgi:hypothetical protein
MAKPNVYIHDVTTGEIINRKMTNEEFEAYENMKIQLDAEETKFNAAIQVKKAARDAVLAKLGLTVDEVAALLG